MNQQQLLQQAESRYLALIATGDFDACDKSRYQFINGLADEMLADPAACLASDLQAKWWRLGYYKPIEHYRRLAKAKGNDSTSVRRAAGGARLLQIVDEGMGTVLGMIRGLAGKYEIGGDVGLNGLFQALGMPSAESNRMRTANSAARRLLAHFLVAAGDLARYKCQASPPFLRHDSLSLSHRFYSHATACNPALGHACNMLAVVESQRERPLATVYWYVRSLCCAEASASGKENLRTYLRSGYCQKQATQWDMDPLVRLILYHLYSGQEAPGLLSYAGLDGESRLHIALILIALDFLQPPLALAPWFPQADSSSSDACDQMILLLAHGFGVVSTVLPAVPVDVEGLRGFIVSLKGFSPLDALLLDLQRSLDSGRMTLDTLLSTVSDTQMESEQEEEVILFKGFISK